MPPTNEGFAETLRTINGGDFEAEATEALRELVQRIQHVAEHGGGKPKGKIVVALTIKQDRGIMEIEPDIKVVTPGLVRNRTIMYGTPDGRLVANDPRQTSLALGPAKDVSTRSVVDIRQAQAGDR